MTLTENLRNMPAGSLTQLSHDVQESMMFGAQPGSKSEMYCYAYEVKPLVLLLSLTKELTSRIETAQSA